MDTLFALLSQLGPVSEELKSQISAKLQFAKFKRKQTILWQGNVCDNLFFVSKGLLRAYYEKDNEEITSWFMMENDFIISVLSFFRRIKSYESIEALESCELIYITYDDLMELYANSLEFNIIGRKLTEHYYCKSEERLLAIRKQTALEKYEFLMQNYPDLTQRVPSKYIASYLGITQETFSRIKAIY
ncbi:cAMP-binding domain of CRP or a regulatory subunit of cAMP-dependent protein kinases [Chitinophaga ginsengisegetis]|jgi:CRP/FNR family transcriptional regulator, anaerobic regulatory protein|uniref:cAMP-binding domain of CRP or a regulatory subunit of cAMP-dependent protein kinases n=1 Tax=Chitinophaga ginsengisegetis TaxID=393003 RepID=A0A1T5PAY2_9BACT|nr:Crp/Fnr family transcriptional regulator [Chitinophaga ginsengisegetis]SKD09836.1 cAMP-binding domain of CRP or a regulatory subunit of cAMP-dependent protein kinases [Chitinophaga ginsengisegetis]